jgi:hypothetical protein
MTFVVAQGEQINVIIGYNHKEILTNTPTIHALLVAHQAPLEQ